MHQAIRLIALTVALTPVGACDSGEGSSPILTREVFFAAAQQCDTVDPLFQTFTNGELPSFSFIEKTTSEPDEETTSQCLADLLEGYRFQSMEIRLARPA